MLMGMMRGRLNKDSWGRTMKDNLVETLVGAAVLLVAALFVVYGYSVTEADGGDGYRLNAQFDRVDGLTIGSDVRMSGIKIGTVTGLNLDPQSYYANAEFVIGSDIELPDDTSAKITSEGLLGGNYVSLSPGGSEDMLAEDDEILYTQGSVDLIGLVSQALFSAGDEESAE
ncbi:outer membrane lipid asymmetry maintenance protein MlaD [Alphaproteobacteria bacterium]|jgi:phospholipid/cholesterol/gamma-HCH transport system substrate-binding protein|nr:outer membrane lipid asymmetry maintenance protein MlaD [Alphaproteobacteria bacterium]MDB2488044.1 outer membrane lipid asymmetry maintenance protein MlaD [Alphaproteobacteria bacterium]MDB2656390.1 outer membrane lipid asymmetry maintenance protein MlaD [Alphaproteobacteria bacterium]